MAEVLEADGPVATTHFDGSTLKALCPTGRLNVRESTVAEVLEAFVPMVI